MATSNLQFVITNAGLQAVANAQGGGPSVNITTFQVGSAFNYTPTTNMTGLQGQSLYSGPINGYSVDSLNQVTYLLTMNQTIGSFQFGEVGVYLSNGTLFALASYSNLQEKVTASSSNSGNIVTILSRLLLSGIAPTISFTNSVYSDAQLIEVPDYSGIPAPNSPTSTNVYSVQAGDDAGNDTLALRLTTASMWSFSTHIPYLSGVTTSGSTTSQTNLPVTAGQFQFAARRYLVQFTSGQNAGAVRQITAVNNGNIQHAALPYANASGVSFTIYRSIASYLLGQLNVYATDSGTPNNYVLTATNSTSSALVDGLTITFVPKNTSSGASTVSYNGGAAVALNKQYNGQTSPIWGIDVVNGVSTSIVYSAASNAFFLQNRGHYAGLNGDQTQGWNTSALYVYGQTSGANLTLYGNGSNPNKRIAASGGNLAIFNNAGNSIFTLNDNGTTLFTNSINLPNNSGIYLADTNNSAQNALWNSSDGFTNMRVANTQGVWRILNSASNASILQTDNNGNVTNTGNLYSGGTNNSQQFFARSSIGYAFTGSTGYYYMDSVNGSVRVPSGGNFYLQDVNQNYVPLIAGSAAFNGPVQSTGNIYSISTTGEAEIGAIGAGQPSAYLYNNATEWGLYSSSSAIIRNVRNDSFIQGSTYSSGLQSTRIGGSNAYCISDSAQFVIQDSNFLSFGYISNPSARTGADNTDPIAFVRYNPASDISVLQLWLGDNGNDTSLPEPGAINGNAGYDFFQIRSFSSNYIAHRWASNGQSLAGGYNARWGRPNGSGTTGFSFYQDGSLDTGMFGLSEGVCALYSNNVNNLQIQPGSIQVNVPLVMNANAGTGAIVWPNGNTQIYQDTNGNGPGDFVIRTGTGQTHNYTVFYNNGTVSFPGVINGYASNGVAHIQNGPTYTQYPGGTQIVAPTARITLQNGQWADIGKFSSAGQWWPGGVIGGGF